MSGPKISFHEAHFIPLDNQSNNDGLMNLCINGSNKLVVTTLRGEVYCLEFHDPLIQRPPSFKSIMFSYIPGIYRLEIVIGSHVTIPFLGHAFNISLWLFLRQEVA